MNKKETLESLTKRLVSICRFDAPFYFYASDFASAPLPDKELRDRAWQRLHICCLLPRNTRQRLLLYTNRTDQAGRLALAAKAAGWSGAVLCFYEDGYVLTTFGKGALRTERLSPSSFAFPPKKNDFTPPQRMTFYLGLLLYAAGATHALLPAMDIARHAVYGQQKTP